jgi:hypothetical protein
MPEHGRNLPQTAQKPFFQNGRQSENHLCSY